MKRYGMSETKMKTKPEQKPQTSMEVPAAGEESKGEVTRRWGQIGYGN